MSYLVAITALCLSGLVILQARSVRLEELISRGEFSEARRLSPYSAAPLYGLALTAEAEGRDRDAERLLREALSLDRGVMPRWTLAGYYLRRQDGRAWPLLADAVKIGLEGGQNVNALFEAAWQFRPDASFLLNNVVREKKEAYVKFLLATNRTAALPDALTGVHDDALIFGAVDALIAQGDYRHAALAWTRLVPASNDGDLLVNTELRTPRPLGFDWKYNSLPELRLRFGDGLTMQFTGRQPDPLELLFQIVPVHPGPLAFAWESRAGDSGLQWQVTDAQNGTVLLSVPVRTGTQREAFTVRDSRAVRLALVARRTSGRTRFEGSAWIGKPSLRQP